MPAPLATPLILPSDLTRNVNASTNSVNTTILLSKIIEESDRIQRWAARRFDEYIETAYYSVRSIARGGDLDGRELYLRRDLRSLTTLTNGDGTEITSTNYLLLPRSPDRNGVANKTSVTLITTSSVFWTAGTNDPEDAISLLGTWGYGGQWRATGTTLAEDLDTSETGVDVVSGALLEAGMMLKVDSEYLYVESVTTNTATVTRAANGSTAATHTIGATVYRWEAEPVVTRHVKRLVLISIAQDSSPLFSQLILGDSVTAVASDGSPRDILFDVDKAGLKRHAESLILGI